MAEVRHGNEFFLNPGQVNADNFPAWHKKSAWKHHVCDCPSCQQMRNAYSMGTGVSEKVLRFLDALTETPVILFSIMCSSAICRFPLGGSARKAHETGKAVLVTFSNCLAFKNVERQILNAYQRGDVKAYTLFPKTNSVDIILED